MEISIKESPLSRWEINTDQPWAADIKEEIEEHAKKICEIVSKEFMKHEEDKT